MESNEKSAVTERTRISGASGAAAPQSSGNQAALVNPVSGLANDYLNLFNEIVMLIEQLPTMPELINDILQWHPVTYLDYFLSSPLPDKDTALAAYANLDEEFRRNFEAVVAELDYKAVGSVAAIRRLFKNNNNVDYDTLNVICVRSGENLRKTLSKATALVNYGTRRSRETAQGRADRLLFGDVRKTA